MSFSGGGTVPLATLQAGRQVKFDGGNPVGTIGGPVMMGLGGTFTFTPAAGESGKIRVVIMGTIGNNTAGDHAQLIEARFGTGAAPANGDAVTGTIFIAKSATNGWLVAHQASAASEYVPFSITGTIDRSASLATAIWIDVALSAGVGGTAALQAVTCLISEDTN